MKECVRLGREGLDKVSPTQWRELHRHARGIQRRMWEERYKHWDPKLDPIIITEDDMNGYDSTDSDDDDSDE